MNDTNGYQQHTYTKNERKQKPARDTLRGAEEDDPSNPRQTSVPSALCEYNVSTTDRAIFTTPATS